MSLSNEQRAHDLTIATVQILSSNPNFLKSINSEESAVNFDVYKIYLAIYNETLQSINRDFSLD